MILFGFILYLILVLVIGILTYRVTKTQADFLIAGRRLNPWVTAFSERASGESAWLLLGLPGAVFVAGLVEIWTVIGCILGIAFAWWVIAKDLRIRTEKYGALTLPEYFTRAFGLEDNRIRVLATLIVVFFYTLYVSAQFNGAGKTLNVTFGIPHHVGILIGACVIVFYTLLGGFFAVAWTDLFQGIIMIITLVVLPIVGWVTLVKSGLSPGFSVSSFFGNKSGWGLVAGVIGGLSWGLGYMGQPHLVTRYMAIRDPEEVRVARTIAILWSIPAFFGAFFIGVIGRALIPHIADAEKVMPSLATRLFPAWFAGILISGAIAAMMSTADSQLLVVTSAFSEDVYHRMFRRKLSPERLVFISRVITVMVGIGAILLAMYSKRLIFSMVSYAWGGLGASFGPPLLLSLKWKKTTRNGVLAGMLVGAISTVVWANIDVLESFLTARLSAFILSLLAVVVVSLWENRKGEQG